MGGPTGAPTHFSKRSFSSLRESFSKNPDYLLDIASSIQKRDIQICLHLFHHLVLTTHNIQDLFFDNDRVCRRRLQKLREHGLVRPFRPATEIGSNPNHHTLADLGAYIVAAELGLEIKDLKLRKDRLTSIQFSPKLRHLLATNTFFSRLIWACRQSEVHPVTEWMSERQVARWLKEYFIYPDGLGSIEGPSQVLRFFIEMDMGTETLDRLARKLDRYSYLFAGPDSPDVLLFCFLSVGREASARKVLRYGGLTIATTVFERHIADPLGPNWLLIGSQTRLSLPDLPIPEGKAA